MLDIKFYDEDSDGWAVLTYPEAIKSSGIYTNLRHWRIDDVGDHPCGTPILAALATTRETWYDAYDSLGDGAESVKKVVDGLIGNKAALAELRKIAEIPFNPSEDHNANNNPSNMLTEAKTAQFNYLRGPQRAATVSVLGGAKRRGNKRMDDDDDEDEDNDDVSTRTTKKKKKKKSTKNGKPFNYHWNSTDNDNSSGSSSSSSSDDDDSDSDNEDSKLSHVFKKSKTDKDQKQYLHVFQLLETQYPEKNYSERFIRIAQQNRNADPVQLAQVFFSKSLLIDDLENDFKYPSSDYTPTKLEYEAKDELNEQDLTHIVTAKEKAFRHLHDADIDSISWDSLGGGSEHNKESISTYVDYYFNQTSKLPFDSSIITLTSNHPVLFAISEESEKHLLQSNGKIDLSIPEESEKKKQRGSTRFDTLQASVTLSLIFHLVHNHLAQGHVQQQRPVALVRTPVAVAAAVAPSPPRTQKKTKSKSSKKKKRRFDDEEDEEVDADIEFERKYDDDSYLDIEEEALVNHEDQNQVPSSPPSSPSSSSSSLSWDQLVDQIKELIHPAQLTGTLSQRKAAYKALKQKHILRSQLLLTPLIHSLLDIVIYGINTPTIETSELSQLLQSVTKYASNTPTFLQDYNTHVSAQLNRPPQGKRARNLFQTKTAAYDHVTVETEKEASDALYDIALTQIPTRNQYYDDLIQSLHEISLIPFKKAFDSFRVFEKEYIQLYVYLVKSLGNAHPGTRSKYIDVWKHIVIAADWLFFQERYRYSTVDGALSPRVASNAEVVHAFLSYFYYDIATNAIDTLNKDILEFSEALKDVRSDNTLATNKLLRRIIRNVNSKAASQNVRLDPKAQPYDLSDRNDEFSGDIYKSRVKANWNRIFPQPNSTTYIKFQESQEGTPAMKQEFLHTLDYFLTNPKTGTRTFQSAKRAITQLNHGRKLSRQTIYLIACQFIDARDIKRTDIFTAQYDLEFNIADVQARYRAQNALVNHKLLSLFKRYIYENVVIDPAALTDDLTRFESLDTRFAVSRTSSGYVHVARPDPDSPAEVVYLLKNLSLRDGRPLSTFLKWNIFTPFGYNAVKLAQRYNAGSMILMLGNGATGYTWHCNEDCSIGEDVKTGIIHAQISLYIKAAVQGGQYIVRAYDVYISEYFGGNGRRVYDNLELAEINHYRDGNIPSKDIHIIPRWIDFVQILPIFDVTGTLHRQLVFTKNDLEAVAYECADVMCELWGWKLSAESPLNKHFLLRPEIEASQNTLSFQGHQFRYNPKTSQLDDVILERGHWGRYYKHIDINRQ